MAVEQTLSIIKPDGVQKNLIGEIYRRFEKAGLRIVAARILLGSQIVRLPGQMQARFEAAMGEWRAALGSRLDFPETQLQLGGLALSMRSVPQAVAAFREAVRLDPQRVEGWAMLVRLAQATEGPAAARQVLDEALAAAPGDPTLRQFQQELDAQ